MAVIAPKKPKQNIALIEEEPEVEEIGKIELPTFADLIAEVGRPSDLWSPEEYAQQESLSQRVTNWAIARGVSPSASWLESLGDYPEQIKYFETESGWFLNADESWTSPEGDVYTRDELIKLLTPEPSVEGKMPYVPTFEDITSGITEEQQIENQTLALRTGFETLFPEGDIGEVIDYYFLNPEQMSGSEEAIESVVNKRLSEFLDVVKEYGRTPEVEAMVRSLYPEITQSSLDEIFGYELETTLSKAQLKQNYQSRLQALAEEYNFPTEESPLYKEYSARQYELEKNYEQMVYSKDPDFMRAFIAGVGDIYSSVSGVAQWLGGESIGEKFNEAGKQLQEMAPPYSLGSFTWGHVFKPEFWAERVGRALPFTLSFLIPAIATGGIATTVGGVAVRAIGGAVTLGRFGTTVLSALPFISGAIAAGTVSRLTESALEAGGAYQMALDKYGEEEKVEGISDAISDMKSSKKAHEDLLVVANQPVPLSGEGYSQQYGIISKYNDVINILKDLEYGRKVSDEDIQDSLDFLNSNLLSDREALAGYVDLPEGMSIEDFPAAVYLQEHIPQLEHTINILQNIPEGYGDAQQFASEVADQVFWNNLKLAGFDIAEFATAFAPISVKTVSNLIAKGFITTVRIAGKITITGLSEAGEEYFQEIFQRQALGEKIEMDAEMQEVMAIGFVMGGVMAGGGDVYTNVVNRTVNNLTPDLKETFDTEKAANLEAGMPEDIAAQKALDVVAETSEGKKIIEASTQIENINQNEKIVKPKTEAGEIVWDRTFEKQRQQVAEETGIEMKEIPTVQRDISETWDYIGQPAQTVLAEKAGLASTVVGVKFNELTSVQQSNLRAVHEEVRAVTGEIKSSTELRDLHNLPARVEGFRNVPIEEVNSYLSRLKTLAEQEAPNEVKRINTAIREASEGDLGTAGVEADTALTNIHKRYKISHPEFELAQPTEAVTGEVKTEEEITAEIEKPRQTLGDIDAALEKGMVGGSAGAAIFKSMREQVAKSMFEISQGRGTYKDIQSLNQHLSTLSDNEVKKLYNRYVNKLEKPPEMVEAEERAKYAERTGMPKGYLDDVSSNRSAEDINDSAYKELFVPIKESPLDIAVSKYLNTGDFEAMVKLLPRVDELKLKALGDTVLTNIDELSSVIDTMGKEIVREEEELTRSDISKQDIKNTTENINNLNSSMKMVEAMIKELRRGKQFTVDDAAVLGIALRETKGGKIVPALRESGFYATKEFTDSEYLRDINYQIGQAEDVISMFEHIDGGRVSRLDGKGVAQKYILWPAHHTLLAGFRFEQTYQEVVHNALDKFGVLKYSKSKRADFVKLVEAVSSKEADFKTKQLLGLQDIKDIVSEYSDKADMVEAAQWVRAFLDEMIEKQNIVRESRNQDPIKFRKNYLPEVAERNIWNRLGVGGRTPADLFRKPPLPDFVNPNQPFNPREQARKGGMGGYLRETNVQKLLFDYTHTAMKDIFYTGIIHNTKINTSMMRAKEMPNSARLIEDWATESFAGVTSHITRGLEGAVPRKGLKGLFAIRRNLTRAVFPFNIVWNLTIQPTSASFTVARTGFRNSIKALDLFLSKEAREQARTTYSYIIKSANAGKMAYQDIGGQIGRHTSYENSIVDTAEKAGNFLTNTVENYLTMWSVRAGYYMGSKLGLEGRALQEYASNIGAKTQSMYNREDRPALLRSSLVTTLFPFQTFMFQSFNFVRETVPIIKQRMRTGAYKDVSIKSSDGKALFASRMKVWVTFIALIVAINMIVDRLTGRKPWVLSSFIPFFSILQGVTDPTNSWNWPLPIQYGSDFWNAFQSFIKYNDLSKARKWLIRYHMIGGTQLNRLIEGAIATSTGEYEDVRGKKLYDVESDEWLKAILLGPYSTRGGQEYIDAMNGEEDFWEQWMGLLIPDRTDIESSLSDLMNYLGTETEGEIFNFGDVVSGLRQVRIKVGDNRFNGSDNPLIVGFRKAEEYSDQLEALLEGVEDSDKRSEIRTNFRLSNPEADAYLSLYAYDGRIQSREAYDLLINLANGLNIPIDCLDTFIPPGDSADAWFDYIETMAQYGKTESSAVSSLHMPLSTVNNDTLKYFYWDIAYSLLRKEDGSADTKARKAFRAAHPEYNDYGVEQGWWKPLEGEEEPSRNKITVPGL